MIGNERSYRQLGRLAEMKAYNDHHKRAFGRDITNMEKKSKKNTSIYEKPPAFKMDARVRSRSLYGRKESVIPLSKSPVKEALAHYKE